MMILGDGAVGKTALMTRFVKNIFKPDYNVTIGVDFMFKELEVKNEKVQLQIWDWLGQKIFQGALSAFSKGARGALLLFDITRKVTFDALPQWMKEIRKGAGNIPIILIGNKRDLENLREVSNEMAINFLKLTNCFGFIETSAKTGDNVEEAFKMLTLEMIRRPKEKLSMETINMDGVSGQLVSKEQIDLINQKIEEILTRPPKEGEFRFLIVGDENAQKPLLTKLLRVEGINWPPNIPSILYTTLDYKMRIDFQDYKFQLYFLSNLKRLEKDYKLFNNACKHSEGIVIFSDFIDRGNFIQSVDMAKMLRENYSDLEIILTSGSDIPTTCFYELERLQKDYEINNSDDYNSLISELLINALKRKKKIDKEIKYMKRKLKELQDQLHDQKTRRELKDFILSLENPEMIKEIEIEKEGPLTKPSLKNVIFISYSHKDEDPWLERVQTHLKPLERLGKINRWDDTRIKAGDKWREEISHSLNDSKVAILLISANFFASDFIAKNELPPLLKAAKTKGTVILPLIISASQFEKIPWISQIQSVNKPDSEALEKLSKGEQEEVFVRLANAVEDALNK